MQRILFVLALVVATALMTTPPMAAEPLLTPSPPVLDVGDEAVKIAKKPRRRRIGYLMTTIATTPISRRGSPPHPRSRCF